MQLFIQKPSIDLYPGVIVDKDTVLEFERENIKQTVEDLVLHSVTKVVGEGFESTLETTIKLTEGEVLLFEEDGRGYIKPVAGFSTVDEAIRDLECIKA